ncbi:EcsC family protein [Thermodesulfatator atlanticus]|uniref:EcsC family protein n=1 Tax=Thermodesulfatator atlanticus TaxID=501497 RepID=UPI0003B4B806|nr:EcsC family protein [Thermodesulfatator atlanticus]
MTHNKQILLTPYDQKALKEIDAWKNRPVNKFKRKMFQLPEKGLGFLQNALDTAGVPTELVETIFKSILLALTDTAAYSVNKKGIYEKFRQKGLVVNSSSDILALELKQIDDLVKHLDLKYKGALTVEGGISSAFSLPGIAVDLAISITGSLRAISEYATYYGFPPEDLEERTYVLYVFTRAFGPAETGKPGALVHLEKVARDILRNKTWAELSESWFVQIAKKVAEQIGVRLTKKGLLKAIPVVGIAISAGTNYHLAHKVCLASFMLYRERFLYRKYNL